MLMAIFAFGSHERDVVRTVPRVIHLNAVLEDGADIFGSVVTAWKDLDRLFRVEPENVLSAAELMGAPVGEETVAVFRVGSPSAAVVAGASFAVIRRGRRLTLPAIPVKSLGNRLFREIAVDRRIAQPDIDLFDFANGAALDNRRHVAVVLHDALAAAGAYAIVFTRRLDDKTGFLKGEGQRFFAVYVFSRLAGFDGNLRVPVVGACAYDRVDVVALENVFVMSVFDSVAVSITLVHAIGGAIEMVFIAVAYANDVIVWIAKETAEQFVAAVAQPDVEQLDRVARRDSAVKPEDATGDEKTAPADAARKERRLSWERVFFMFDP